MNTPLKSSIIGAVAVVALPCAAEAAESARKPNVVLMVADDLGIGDLSCYGAKKIRTPNIDAIAAAGVRCTDAQAPAAVCTPTRYGILTGRYFWRIKSEWQGEAIIEMDRPTVASVLRDAGYATGYFGKWHLGWGIVDPAKRREHRAELDWNAPEIRPGVLETGFDRYFGTPFSANEPPAVFVNQRTVVDLDPSDPLVVVGPKVEKAWGYGVSRGAAKAHAARPLEEIDPIVAGKAVDFLRENKDRPFFLHIAWVAPHVPVAPNKEFSGRTPIGRYGDFVEQLDACVGQVMSALRELGLERDTLVVFTSDNGAILDRVLLKVHQSNLNLLGQKTDAWQGGVRVPLVAQWPGRIPAGSVDPRLLSLTDLFATSCAAAGVPVPDGAAEDSINQLPALEDPSKAAPRSEMVYQGIFGFALRSGDWVFLPGQGSFGVTTDPKMAWAVQFHERAAPNSDYDENGKLREGAPPVQLYDLAADPNQTKNVARDHADVTDRLAARLKELTAR